jgi:hypothetical protein
VVELACPPVVNLDEKNFILLLHLFFTEMDKRHSSHGEEYALRF